jgi:hypothetical protein
MCLPSARAYVDRIQPRVGEELDLGASTCRSLGRGLISDLRKSKVCALGRGQWTVDSGQWAVGSGQWAVGSRLSTQTYVKARTSKEPSTKN